MTRTADNSWTMAEGPAVIEKKKAISGVQVAAAICFVALGLALLGFYWSAWTAVPMTLRFIVGVVVFGVSPGLLIVGPFLSHRRHQLDPSDVVLSIVTCSFSCNLALNIVLFALQWSLTDLARVYVLIQIAGYAIWQIYFYLAPRGDTPPETRGGARTARLSAGALVFLIAAAAVVYMTYVRGAPITNPEELVGLRKLVENPSVRYDNVSYRKGDPTTYLFVPFQILIAGVSVVARADISLTYSLFWCVTTALSMFIIARLAFVLFARMEVVALVCLWMFTIALFEPNSVIYGPGLVVPFPNRYGFAGGVLLPLILLLFWSVLRDPRVQLWRWALLVYIAVEMTFVHARETLLAAGTMAMAFAILAARPWRNRRQILRIATVIGITGVVLVVYKRVNLGLAPDLDAYVGAMTRASRTALMGLMSDHSPLNLLTVAVPKFTQVIVEGSKPITLTFATYNAMFVETWSSYLGRLYLPFALLVLPVYAIRARSVGELSLAGVLAALGLITSSGFLTFLISAIVGSPEVLIAYNLVALFSILVLCSVACDAAAALAERCRGSTLGVSLSVSSESGSRRTLGRDVSLARALVVGCLLLVTWSFFSVDRIITFRDSLSRNLPGRMGFVLLVSTVLAAAYRVRRRDLPVLAPVGRAPALTMFTASCLIFAVLLPAVRRSGVWLTNPFRPAHPSYRFTGDLYRDYAMLTAPGSHKLDPSPYPLDVIRFLREGVPPNQTLLTSDALALLERVPHFAAILSNKGEVGAQYIVNTTYLRDYSRSGTNYAIAPYFIDQDGIQRFVKMAGDFRVDVVVVDPAESDVVRAARERSDALHRLLRPVYDKDGYVIYIVDRHQPDSGTRQSR
jgi:hypothetical protein